MAEKFLELNKIYHGDCLELIKKLPNNSIDLICTDPPYCIGVTSNGKKGTPTDFNLIRPFFDELYRDCERVLKDGGEIYINSDWRSYPLHLPLLQKYFDVRNCIVWDYEWLKTGNFYRFSYELILYATKGKCKRKFEPTKDNRDVWRIPPINYTNPNKYHSVEKPVELMEKMIKNSSEVGEVVLDCFIGSGTTAVAAMKCGRKFIGFELNDENFAFAEKRIAGAVQKFNLFS